MKLSAIFISGIIVFGALHFVHFKNFLSSFRSYLVRRIKTLRDIFLPLVKFSFSSIKSVLKREKFSWPQK